MSGRCFLCRQGLGIDTGNSSLLLDAEEVRGHNFSVLCNILNIPHLLKEKQSQNYCKKIRYCQSCTNRIQKTGKLLDELEELEKTIFEAKLLIESQIKQTKVTVNVNSPEILRVRIVNELKIMSTSKKVRSSQIRKELWSSSTKHKMLAKNLSIPTQNEQEQIVHASTTNYPDHILISNNYMPSGSESDKNQELIKEESSIFSNHNFQWLRGENKKMVGEENKTIWLNHDYSDDLDLKWDVEYPNHHDHSIDDFSVEVKPEFQFGQITEVESKSEPEVDPLAITETDLAKAVLQGTKSCSSHDQCFEVKGIIKYHVIKAATKSRRKSLRLRHEKDKMENHQHKCTFFVPKVSCKRVGNRNFKCRYCQMRFVSLTFRSIHEKDHHHPDEYKNFDHKCTYCEKICNNKFSLTVHLRTHKGEKPYKCQYCELSFAQHSAKKTHEEIHTLRERNHTCQYCGKMFRSVYVLHKHERIHQEETHHSCQTCGKRYVSKASANNS